MFKKKKAEALPVVDFPRPFWFYWPSIFFWRKWNTPVYFGADEYGRHTISFGIPGIVGICFAYKVCGPGCSDYDDPEFGLQDSHCAFPGCPLLSMHIDPKRDVYCLVHDLEFWTEWIQEEQRILDAQSGN